MRLSSFHIVLGIVAVTAQSAILVATPSQRYHQLVLPFNSPKQYHFQHEADQNTLELEIKGASASQLSRLDHYNEELIRRVIVREAGSESTYVRFMLRDDDVRVSVAHFSEPFRIVLDFYDVAFQELRDTETGLPVVSSSTTPDRFSPVWDSERLDPQREESSHHPALRRNFQAPNQTVRTPEQLQDNLSNISEGMASGWDSFPIYVYRLENAPTSYDRTHKRWLSSLDQNALPAAVAMADYASSLFDYGHENRALIAYQQVLQQDPLVFDQSPVHLWKFAETHLAHGNLTLADGYFDALINKHSESPLTSFAQLRRLDIRAIRMQNQSNLDALPQLTASLNQIRTASNNELKTLIGIRNAYWNSPEAASLKILPEVSATTYTTLSSSNNNEMSQRSSFLSANLQLKYLIESAPNWSRSHSEFATQYFRNFQGPSSEPYRTTLSDMLRSRLKDDFSKLYQEASYLRLISRFEELPSSLQSIRKDSVVAWALADSYRRAGQFAQALPFYGEVVTNANSEIDRFRAQYWQANIAGKLAAETNNANASGQHRQTMRSADQAMQASWNRMNNEEKSELLTAFRHQLERSIDEPVLLSTPAEIIFDTWSKSFSTDSTAATNLSNISEIHTSSAKAVHFLTRLATRFSELGLQQRRRETLALMQHFRPSQMSDDRSAQQIWSSQIVTLADEYRLNNQFLEAGRMYALAGSESNNWEDRAETLYKGGLLLYRAGRREEAINAFEQASQDGNNQFYANLARERLTRLLQ